MDGVSLLNTIEKKILELAASAKETEKIGSATSNNKSNEHAFPSTAPAANPVNTLINMVIYQMTF